MKAAVGLLLMLLGVSHAVETHCDGRQDGAQCYGALGGTVVLRLMDSASDIFKFRLLFNTSQSILDVTENKISVNRLESRSIFTLSNGTFRINDLNRSDGGEYTLNMFDSQGQNTGKRTLQLFIQAPVSNVTLVTDCLSQGELKASCVSERGDSPEYSWTLDGRTLTDDKLLYGNNQNNTITLKQDVSGLLACSVKNNVSYSSNKKQISTCGFIYIDCDINGTSISKWVYEANNTLCIPSTTPPTTTKGPDTTVGKETIITVSDKPNNSTSINQTSFISSHLFYIIMAGALSALMILLVVGVVVIYTQKKKKGNTPAEEADEQELTYADVRILQRQKRQEKQREEVEVEYGQVKFSGRPRQNVEPAENDCVYATVRKDR